MNAWARLRDLRRSPDMRRRVGAAIRAAPVGSTTALRVARWVDARLSASERVRVTAGGVREVRPATYRITPSPPPITTPWPDPPPIDDPHRFLRSVETPAATEPVHGIELFEALNEEYASRPIVPRPPGRDAGARSDKARQRLDEIHQAIGLAGQRVLEFGCGAGYEVWYLAHHFGADATGVDVAERRAWATLRDPRTSYVLADLAVDRPFEADTFDRILSFSVFEHVAHPYAVLRELHRIMKPGGIAWIMANLHQGPMASHLYHDVFFPWPHLLFEDEVFREYFARRGRTVPGPAWVNRLTWAQYENHIHRVGFELLAVRFSETRFDEEFYRRFERTLGRYARWDLSRDFFHAVLRKPAGGRPAAT